jgi:uncharacterized protein with HEPN domain
MHEAVSMALHMAAGRSRAELSSDPMLTMTLTRTLEILGEAASRLSVEARLRFASIPYSKMIAMRNRLIHASFDVDLDVVWTTITEDLPPLLRVLESSLAQLEE